MNTKESQKELKALHKEVLRTHALLIKKHSNMVKADKKITEPSANGEISSADIANYTKARNEAFEAHLIWATAQTKYFKFIEKRKVVSHK